MKDKQLRLQLGSSGAGMDISEAMKFFQSNPLFKNVDFSLEFVTPDKSAEYYATTLNRNVRANSVNRYSTIMDNGGWYLGCDALIFDTQGRLRNGQHRMLAVMKSGKGQWFLIRRNVDEKELVAIDSGAGRSLTDATCFNEAFGQISEKDSVAMKSAVTQGYLHAHKDTSHGTLAGLIKKYRYELDTLFNDVFDRKRLNGITNASVYGVFFRAIVNNHPLKDLKNAGSYLVTGWHPPLEPNEDPNRYQTLNCLRNWLIGAARLKGAGRTGRIQVYRTTQYMLWCFLNQEIRTRIKVGGRDEKKDYFPFETPDMLQGNMAHIELTIAMNTLSRSLKEGDVISPNSIAIQMVAMGFGRRLKNPTRSTAGLISRHIREFDGDLLKDGFPLGEGYLFPKTYGRIVDGRPQNVRDYVYHLSRPQFDGTVAGEGNPPDPDSILKKIRRYA